ncbi:MAG TPA: energy transducer TonB [Kofleriaceae bacterium]|nr:energy transducer TonB [Kofleriaceae bacterium]
MIIDRRLALCAVASVAGHLAFARGLDHLPARRTEAPPPVIAVRVVEPPAPAPEPEPVRPPEPPRPPEPVPPVVHERPRPRPAPAARRDAAPVDTPPVDTPPATTDTTTTPVFGVTMQSTSQAGSGPAMPVGNTAHPAPSAPGAAVKPLAAPVAAVEVTRMPLPQGRCAGKYTDEARAAATEGVVVLDLIVDEHGRARDIAVVGGLPHGLTEAAIAALTACRFSPGERDGQPVAVRIRGFKIRFVLQDAQ